MTRTFLLLLAASWAGAGCAPDLTLEPAQGPLGGNFEVRASSPRFAGLPDPLRVTVGGVEAFNVLREDLTTVRFSVQGAPAAGSQAVVVWGPRASQPAGELVYTAPR